MYFSRQTLLLLVLFVSLTSNAQFVDYGTDPAGYKWNYVNTDHYKIIYPQGSDSTAYRYASFLETAFYPQQKTIGASKIRRFPVILHPGNMLSNGMVAWAPRRMEMITTPGSDLYAQSWDRQLAIHESRHVMQTTKLMSGIFNPLYYLVGEQAQGVAALFMPKWFFEGDAVATETGLSHSGRGRLPEFNMIYRAQMASGKFYSFDKWSLGSHKDYTGSYYALGYNLVSYARYKYGADVWDKISSRYVRRIFSIPPFANSVKYYTGLTPQGLFDETYTYLAKEWGRQEAFYQRWHVPVTYHSPENNHYTSYKDPQSLNDSTILAVKSGLKDINSLVMLRGGQEKRLAYLGNINSGITLKKDKVYWSEYVPGLRWTHKNYSVIKYYDLKTKKINTLTPRQRYLNPEVSSVGGRIAASSVSTDGRNNLVLVNAFTGKETNSYPTPGNAFVKEITFTNWNTIVANLVTDNGIKMYELSPVTGKWEAFMPQTWVNITSPAWKGGKLYFESGYNGTNNIYSYDPVHSRYERITAAQFGAFMPEISVSGKRLIFSDYQANGYRVASIAVDSLKKEVVSFNEPYRFTLAENLTKQENFQMDTVPVKDIHFMPKRYYKASHLFKIHSWAPFYYDVMDVVNLQSDDFTSIVKPGATIISQNALNTAVTQLGWYYREGYHHGKLAFSYMGWYPVIDLSVDYGGKAFTINWEKNDEGKNVARGYYTDRNLIEAEARIYVPFNLTRNHYIRGIQPSVTYYFTNNKYQQFESGKLSNFQYLLSELRFYNYRKMAKRDILPKWGYQLRLQHLYTPFNTENYGSLYAARLTTYLPGLIGNNGLMLRLSYQYQDMDHKKLYVPKQLINEPRGYNYISSTRQQATLQGDYSFNLLYPDISLGPVAYIQRIRANVFYDISYNQVHKNSGWDHRSSFGGDLIFDWNALQSDFPIMTGIRVSKPIDYGKLQTEMLFSISF